MSYTVKNSQVFTAAYSGALAGMGLSDRVISDPNAASYAGVATVAGAFAQALDTAWGAVRATTLLDVEAIQSATQAAWQDRAPNATTDNTNPSSWAALALAIIASITASESYYSAQGITAPAIPTSSTSPSNQTDSLTTLGAVSISGVATGTIYYVLTLQSWFILSLTSTQTADGITVIAASGGTGRWLRLQNLAHPSWLTVGAWYIDATNGNDENNGQASAPAANNVGPLKTHAELERRWNSGILNPAFDATLAAKLCVVNILTSLPTTDPINITVTIPNNTILGYEGSIKSTLYTGAITGITAQAVATNQQFQWTDTSLTGTWTTRLKQRVRITSGARANTTWFVAKDLGGQTARASQPFASTFLTIATTAKWALTSSGAAQTPQIGDPYVVEELVQVTMGIVKPVFPAALGTLNRLVFAQLDKISSSPNQQEWGHTTVSSVYTVVGKSDIVQAFQSLVSQAECFTGIVTFLPGSQTTHTASVFFGNMVMQGVGQCFLLVGCMVQGAGIFGVGVTFANACVFDSPGHGVNIGFNGTHGMVGSCFVTGSFTGSIWGSGNTGAGVLVQPGCMLHIRNNPVLAITGTSGNFLLNNLATGRAWNEATGLFTAAINNTWTLLTTVIGSGGFGNQAQDVASGARVGIEV